MLLKVQTQALACFRIRCFEVLAVHMNAWFTTSIIETDQTSDCVQFPLGHQSIIQTLRHMSVEIQNAALTRNIIRRRTSSALWLLTYIHFATSIFVAYFVVISMPELPMRQGLLFVALDIETVQRDRTPAFPVFESCLQVATAWRWHV